MKLAITGCNGSVGKPLVRLAIQRGHVVVGIDIVQSTDSSDSFSAEEASRFTYLSVDLRNYDDVLDALRGCDGVLHLAAYRNPGDFGVTTHNSNVVISWNVLRGCAELGINRVAQASSVNIITLVFSKKQDFKYFPIDEMHPCLPDEPYGLSKLICEMQADTIVRRYPNMRIASLRLHWSLPDPVMARKVDANHAKNDLWGYLQEDAGADAFLRAVVEDNGKWSGHEAFFIVAPMIAYEGESKQLKEQYWPDVPVRAGHEIDGTKGFFDCSKAKRLLDWVHP